jgi:preprotein translocase subunit SecE
MNRATGTTQADGVQRTQAFFRGLVSEMKRVTWPSRQEWTSATVLTIGLVVGIGLFTYCIDSALTWLFGLLHH